MHIAIDVREACRPQPTGKGAWTLHCVTALLTHSEHTFTLLTDADVPPHWVRSGVKVVRLPSGLRWHWYCIRWLRRHIPDAFLSPTSFIVTTLVGRSVPCVPVVHDLIAFRSDPHQWRAKLLEHLFLPRALRKAAHVCCISEATKTDLLYFFPRTDARKVTCVFAGPSQESASHNEPDGKTILNVGTLCPRKNQRRLILAYRSLPAQLRKQYRLVLAGHRGWQDGDIVALASDTEGVEWSGYIPENEYNRLLSTCTLFAFPSLYEGFGLPVLDAMQRGVPVLTSARGSLAEVADGAACIVNPENVSAIAHELERLLMDTDLRRELCTKGMQRATQFSWKRTAMLVSNVLHSLECI